MMQKNRALNILKQYIFKEKKAISLLLGISMISSSIAIIQPLLMQKFIDEALMLKDLNNFYFYVLLIIIISVVGIALSVFLQYRYTSLSVKILYKLRLDIFEKIFSNSKLFFQKYQIGDLLSRLEGDINELQRFGLDSIFALFSAFLGLIGALIVMFYFDTSLALFALVLFPIEFYLLKPIYPKMHDITKELRQSTAIIGSFIIESLRYVDFLKKFNNIDERKDNLYNLQNVNKNRILKQQKIQIVFTQIPVIISLIARTTLIIFGGLKVMQNEISIGELIAFLSYFSMILSPVHTLLGILNNIPKLKVSINRLNEIIPVKENKKTIKNLEKNLHIKIENLSFIYQNKQEIFNNINLEIKAKEKVLITGNNGTGKSTLTNLLLNFLNPTTGKISIGDFNINDISNTTLQRYIGLVEQNPVILNTTLKENLLISKKDASEEELKSVLEKVGLNNFINKLNETLDEDGKSLSGGQKQRISIARLILQKPSIVILDEPTSSLDKEFLKVIDTLIDENFKDASKIIISHQECFKNAIKYKIEKQDIKRVEDE
jgi:ATP-binding cassette, subfamily B, bacterial